MLCGQRRSYSHCHLALLRFDRDTQEFDPYRATNDTIRFRNSAQLVPGLRGHCTTSCWVTAAILRHTKYSIIDRSRIERDCTGERVEKSTARFGAANLAVIGSSQASNVCGTRRKSRRITKHKGKILDTGCIQAAAGAWASASAKLSDH